MRDFACPLAGLEGQDRPTEYLLVNKHGGGIMGATYVEYEVPRECAEALGIDCSPIDRGDGAAVWFNRDQAAALRGHRHAVQPPAPLP